MSARRVALISVLPGVLAALGQAPFDLWPVSLIGFAGAIWLNAKSATPRKAAFALWLTGTAYFAVALHWIVEPFLVDATRHGWMAPFALVLMAGGLALFWALAGWLSVRFASSALGRFFLFPPLLLAAEAVRATIFTGFPWAQPGHGLIDTSALQIAAWTGPFGLTLLLLLAATGLALLVEKRWAMGLASVLPLTAALVLPVPSAPMPSEAAPVVRLIQPNAPQHLKWEPEMIPVFFERGLALTASEAETAPALIVWPETSLPVILGRSDAARARISAAAGGASVLLGAQRIEAFTARNSAVLLAADGSIADIYDKHHLVPFGEYMPAAGFAGRLGLRGLAEVLSGGYAEGPGPQAMALGQGLGRTFVMICYEAIFPSYIRDVPRPDWMVHLTNDAWFGAFSGPYQHLALARLRAAEQGLPVLRAANTGVSAVIDARGQIRAALPLGEAGALDAPLPPPLPPTLYARTGDAPIFAAALVLLVLGLWLGRRRGPLPSLP